LHKLTEYKFSAGAVFTEDHQLRQFRFLTEVNLETPNQEIGKENKEKISK
jgi:hypothetical protein